MKGVLEVCVVLINFGIILSRNEKETLKLYAMTVASEENDGLDRLRRSASVYGVNLQIFFDLEWVSREDVTRKIYRMRKEIVKFKNEETAVLLFVDAFDVMFNADENEILNKFLEFKANIVFGAEINDLCNKEKKIIFDDISKDQDIRYLNSGTIIGYAPYMYQLYYLDFNDTMKHDQCVMTNHFLDPKIRQGLNIKLDFKQHLFQTLYEINEGLDLEFSEDDARLVNTRFNTRPSVIHGNGASGKKILKQYQNYIAKSWTPSKGCMNCNKRIDLDSIPELDYPRVLLGVFVTEETPLLKKMLQKVLQQVYPKEKIFFFLYNNAPCHENELNDWIQSEGTKYPVLKYASSFEHYSHAQSKHMAMNMCYQYSCDVFFNVDSKVHLDNPNTLSLLISYNRTILAPIMSQDYTSYSTYFGDMNRNFYNQSFDHDDIVTGARRGIWSVPCIYWVYVMWRRQFDIPRKINYAQYATETDDADMSFCVSNKLHFRDNFMYAINLEYYGHVINKEINYSNDVRGEILHPEDNPKNLKSSFSFTDQNQDWKITKSMFKNSSRLDFLTSFGLLLGILIFLWIFILHQNLLFSRRIKLIVNFLCKTFLNR